MKSIILHEHEVRRLAQGLPVLVVRPINPQPTLIESSGRWTWTIPRHLWVALSPKRLRGGVCPAPDLSPIICTASREWHEYMPPGCCPLGQNGEVRYVREAWRPVMESYRSCIEYADGTERALLGADADKLASLKWIALRFSGANKERHSEKWRSAASMPEWASRRRVKIENPHVVRCILISTTQALEAGFVTGERESPSDAMHNEWDRRYGKRYPWATSWAWAVIAIGVDQ